MGRATEGLRSRLTKLGRAYTRGYEIQCGGHTKRINEDNVTTWNDQRGNPVTAEEDDETGLLCMELTVVQAIAATTVGGIT